MISRPIAAPIARTASIRRIAAGPVGMYVRPACPSHSSATAATAATSASCTSALFHRGNGARTTPSALIDSAHSHVLTMNSPGNRWVHSRPEVSMTRCSARWSASSGSSSSRLVSS